MVTRRVQSPLNDEFEKLVHASLEKWHVPGISIAVVDRDNTWSGGYGIAKFPSTPVTPSTLMYAGSTTKAFTSAIMGMLVEDNDTYPQVQWDTPMSKLMPEDFVLSDEYATQHITVEDALSHRSGLPRHDCCYGNNNLPRDVAMRQAVRQMRHLPLTAQPRTKFQYCNVMYFAASHAIETVTGEWLGDTLARRIWTPLDMKSTYFDREDALNAKDPLARGYVYAPDKDVYRETEYMNTNEISGAGAIITNVLDYAKWARSLLGLGPSVLSKELQKDLWMPRSFFEVEEDPKKTPWTGFQSYSFGWIIGVYQGHQFYEHTGGTIGFGAEIILFPDLGYSFVSLGNTALSSNFVAKKIAFHLIDEKLGVPADQRFDWDKYNTDMVDGAKEGAQNAIQRFYPSLPSPTLPTTLPLSAYAGSYSHPGYQTVTLYIEEAANGDVQRLRADRSFTTFPQVLSFEHVSGEYFVVNNVQEGLLVPNVYPAEFRLGADGRVAELGIGWEEEMKGEKIWLKRD